MKKNNFLTLIGLLVTSLFQAQNTQDVLQYTQQDIRGTARYRALSGAFGALGGDISAIADNPAGSAVFSNSYGAMTISSSSIANNTNYFNNTIRTKKRSLNFNQLGAVLVMNNTASSATLNKITLGLSYNQTADHRDRYIAAGLGNTSIDSYFLTDAAGLQLQDIQQITGQYLTDGYIEIGELSGLGFSAQQAFLGLAADIISPEDANNPENTTYISTLGNGPFDQQYTHISHGFNGKLTANLGLQFADKYYIGINLNSHFSSNTKITEFSELDNNPDSDVKEVLFYNDLTTEGSGFSLDLGGIAKVSDQFRLGLSYTSPTWHTIIEEFSQYLVNIGLPEANNIVADPNIRILLPEYQLRTPGKLTGSAALIFGKQGLISIDYSYKDYATTRLSSQLGDNFSATNTAIKETFTATSAVKLGGEYRYENWSYRAGYRYEESPYKDQNLTGGYTGYSLGLGYNFGKIKIDAAYDHLNQQSTNTLYPGSGFETSTTIDRTINTITATVGINF